VTKQFEKYGDRLLVLVERGKDWIATSGGEFSAYVFGCELGLKADPELRDEVLLNLREMGLIEPSGRKRGHYSTVADDCQRIDWQTATDDWYPLWLPLGIGEKAGTRKKNIIVVAGETNAGKTAFVLNTVHKNLAANGGKHKRVWYFNSEMGPDELRGRLLNIGRDVSHWDGLEAFERVRDFHQVIRPEGLNVIDFMEITQDFSLVGAWITAIHERLQSGVAIVCLQKKKGEDTGRGGEFTLEKCRLGLALSYNHGVNACKIVKCKNPVGITNPQGQEIDFEIERGSSFKPVSEWRWMTARERRDKWRSYETRQSLRSAMERTWNE
jgi:hypothetical protein